MYNDHESKEVSFLCSNKINREALFCDGTKDYRLPVEASLGEKVIFRFRVAKNNVDEVHMVMNQKDYLMNVSIQMPYFDFYETQIELLEEENKYYFYIIKQLENGQREICYYTAVGVANSFEERELFMFTAGFKTPDWAKGAVFYQIFVDRFYNGDPRNDVEDNEYLYINEGTKEVCQWNKYPSTMGVREFYGGDLLGIIKKLDYLQDLGVDVLYLNPIFVSPSNHKYDIQDYDYVDPHYGVIKHDVKKQEGELKSNRDAKKYIERVTNKENLEESNRMLAKLVEELHKRGMRLVLDGVFNHCGSYNKWMDREGIYENVSAYEKGAYVDEKSKYRWYFDFYQADWPYNDHYEGWWGHNTLPKLNYEGSKDLYDYIMYIARKWVSPPYCVDGWRLDVAADLGHSEEFNHHFWRDFRKNVRMANPDALILAEHYGDASSWLKGDQWDSIMNFDAFMEPVTWFLTGMQKHSDEYRPDLLGNAAYFIDTMNRCLARFQSQSLMVAMNELSNHDHSRFITRTNRVVGRVQSRGAEAANDNLDYGIYRAGIVMQFTWQGAPTIYYGDEAGVCGWTDPDNRRTYPWGHENKEFIELHRELISLRKSYDSLRIGSLKILYGQQDVIAYGRFDQVDKILVAVNISECDKWIRVPVWQMGVLDEERMVQLMETSKEGYSRKIVFHEIAQGFVEFMIKPKATLIIKNYVPYKE